MADDDAVQAFCNLLQCSDVGMASTMDEVQALLSASNEWKNIGDRKAKASVAAFIAALNETSCSSSTQATVPTEQAVVSASLAIMRTARPKKRGWKPSTSRQPEPEPQTRGTPDSAATSQHELSPTSPASLALSPPRTTEPEPYHGSECDWSAAAISTATRSLTPTSPALPARSLTSLALPSLPVKSWQPIDSGMPDGPGGGDDNASDENDDGAGGHNDDDDHGDDGGSDGGGEEGGGQDEEEQEDNDDDDADAEGVLGLSAADAMIHAPAEHPEDYEAGGEAPAEEFNLEDDAWEVVLGEADSRTTRGPTMHITPALPKDCFPPGCAIYRNNSIQQWQGRLQGAGSSRARSWGGTTGRTETAALEALCVILWGDHKKATVPDFELASPVVGHSHSAPPDGAPEAATEPALPAEAAVAAGVATEAAISEETVAAGVPAEAAGSTETALPTEANVAAGVATEAAMPTGITAGSAPLINNGEDTTTAITTQPGTATSTTNHGAAATTGRRTSTTSNLPEGAVLVEVPADGRCLFYAIAAAIDGNVDGWIQRQRYNGVAVVADNREYELAAAKLVAEPWAFYSEKALHA